jgi:hypothetical protein
VRRQAETAAKKLWLKLWQSLSSISEDGTAEPNERPEGRHAYSTQCLQGILQCGAMGKVVGAKGFEPLTFCTPSKRATSLRYAPKTMQIPWEPINNSSSQSRDEKDLRKV